MPWTPSALRRRRLPRLLALLLSLFSAILPPLPAAPPPRPPNIVFILADDLGYGDLGAYGQRRIQTPHLDRLAAGGLKFTQHYSGNAVCAPSRCVLLTGRHPGHALVRDNREIKPEGQHPLPEGTPTLPALLRSLGYRTGAFGKWGLGGPGSSGDPLDQGFDRFFGYNCQRVAHNYYPTHLWDDRQRLELDNPPFAAHQRFPTNANPADPGAFARYNGRDYAPDRIVDQAVRFIHDHHDRPFFLYFPSTIPHLALQVPEDSLAEYRGKFPEEAYLGQAAYLPHPAPRAAYAAMVSRLDRDVGRLLDALRERGLEDNTLVIFTSDNGPLYDRLGGTDTDFFDSAGGLRGRKGSLHEGGFRVPCLVQWKGHIAPGTTSTRVTGFEDWLPTLLELAEAPWLIPPGTDGVSFAPTLLGRRQSPRPFLYREFPAYGGWQILRAGDWKLVRRGLQPGANRLAAPVTELFHLGRDPGETTNLADQEPRRVRRLLRLARQQHTSSTTFPFAVLDQETPAR